MAQKVFFNNMRRGIVNARLHRNFRQHNLSLLNGQSVSFFNSSFQMGTIRPHLNEILSDMPFDWKGTTFANNVLLGRKVFSEKLLNLKSYSHDNLAALGNAEDYMRVSTNISTIYELTMAESKGLSIDNVFCFGSSTMPIIAIGIGTKKTVYLDTIIFNDKELKMLKTLGCHIIQNEIQTEIQNNENGLIVMMEKEGIFDQHKNGTINVDCIIGDHLLYLVSTKVDPEDILTIRKRMSTPLTTPVTENKLLEIAGMQTNPIKVSTPEAILDYKSQLQTLCGTKSLVDPITFTAGLPALSALFATLIHRGGCDLFMASTAYGGSSQLVDLYSEHASDDDKKKLIIKHKFDIQGKAGMIKSIRSKLDAFSEKSAQSSHLPTTVLFVEIPTNPDMKVPDIEELAMILSNYGKKTGKATMLLVDCTFAPGSEIMEKLKLIVPELNVMVFISLSKSISRGTTTAGTLVGNHTVASAELMNEIHTNAETLDTIAKDDQMLFLTNNIDGVKQRCLDAYQVAKSAGDVLVESVKEVTGQTMELAFVTPEEAAQGFTTSTFSFNLPGVSTDHINRTLAQKFVDLLTKDHRFKPCVSFGQDNRTVYATVPATSTQGAISEEDKNKQEIGGVQLTRLSFPPSLDEKEIHDLLKSAVVSLYANAK